MKEYEVAPTYREMAKALKNKSIADIGRKLNALASDGKIKKRTPAKTRDIELL